MRLGSVTRIAAANGDDFHARFVANGGQPVIISGGAANWKSTRTWSFDLLARQFGAIRVPVRKSDDEFVEFFSGPRDPRRPRLMLRFSEYLAQIKNTTADGVRPAYAGNISFLGDPSVSSLLRSMLTECEFPNFLNGEYTDEYRLWIAAAGQRSTIHNDPYHNFNAQILGEKRFILFAPTQHKFLYPQFFHSGLWVSPADPRSPDLQKFPQFSELDGYEGNLKAGDILFIPRFWWHSFETTKTSINVNRWLSTAQSDLTWWHQQPEARDCICYTELADMVKSQFDELDPNLQDLQRPQFQALHAEIANLSLPVR